MNETQKTIVPGFIFKNASSYCWEAPTTNVAIGSKRQDVRLIATGNKVLDFYYKDAEVTEPLSIIDSRAFELTTFYFAIKTPDGVFIGEIREKNKGDEDSGVVNYPTSFVLAASVMVEHNGCKERVTFKTVYFTKGEFNPKTQESRFDSTHHKVVIINDSPVEPADIETTPWYACMMKKIHEFLAASRVIGYLPVFTAKTKLSVPTNSLRDSYNFFVAIRGYQGSDTEREAICTKFPDLKVVGDSVEVAFELIKLNIKQQLAKRLIEGQSLPNGVGEEDLEIIKQPNRDTVFGIVHISGEEIMSVYNRLRDGLLKAPVSEILKDLETKLENNRQYMLPAHYVEARSALLMLKAYM